MGYFEVLGLNREPFSTSPDPAFFYQSAAHHSALQRLEISIRLRRGLSLILGDVGTGKTTLGRTLSQSLSESEEIEMHLILNPLYQSEFQFLESLCKMFGIQKSLLSSMDCLEALQETLYQKGVVQGKTLLLLIDEGQNLKSPLLEVLRSLLNFETNEHKLLQLVIMAQMEALPRFQRIRNFIDRVNLKYTINPLDQRETLELIRYRLAQAGLKSGQPLFTDEAMNLIFEASQGYPRKITLLCHKALEEIVIEGKTLVKETMVSLLIERELNQQKVEVTR